MAIAKTMPGDPPTARQGEMMEFIRTFKRGRGYPPSMDDFREAFGFASRNSAHCHLRALKKKGLIRWEPYKSRSLTVVGDDGDDPARLRAEHAELLAACRDAVEMLHREGGAAYQRPGPHVIRIRLQKAIDAVERACGPGEGGP